MSSGNKPSWGSFIQQAVAGVEARLDNMLAEEEEQGTAANSNNHNTNLQPQPSTARGVTSAKQQQSPAISRTASTSSRTNDRLKQRLQRAVAAKTIAQTTPTDSPRQSLDQPRQSSDRTHQSLDHSKQSSIDKPRLSQDTDGPENTLKETDNSDADITSAKAAQEEEEEGASDQHLHPVEDAKPAANATEPVHSSSDPLVSIQPESPPASITAKEPDVKTHTQSENPKPETDKVVAALMAKLGDLKSTLQVKERQVSSLETRLQKTLSSLEAANRNAGAASTSERDRKKMGELEETVASLQVEKRLASDRAKIQIADLKDQAVMAAKHAHTNQLESKAELMAIESRLEAMRAQAEEVTTGPHADSEAKLLRQLQTLQVQHASASANWQGIETTLLSRITYLEAERDEALRRESDMRKKARDAAARAKRQEEELEEARSDSPALDHINSQHKAQVEKLTRRAEMAEAGLASARSEIEKQKEALKEEKPERPNSERRTWLDDLPQTFRPGSGSRPASPQLSVPVRTFSADHLGAPPMPANARKLSSPSSNGEQSPGLSSQAHPRRPSALSYIQSMVSSTGGGGGAAVSPMYGSTFGDVETPPAPPDDKDEMSDPIESLTSPTYAIHEVASISTIAAGPSVQLVERMSAAIRRLESEKVAAKEELLRISSQRNEARSEIVTLMKEIEVNRAAPAKVAYLETQVEDINQRYQTTLELLGEKSELVEELTADVEDVKQMYRDLVERTVR